MAKAPITRYFFQRMRGRMPKIQNAARASIRPRKIFTLIAGDDRSFEATMRGDDGSEFGTHARVARLVKKVHRPIEQLATSDCALLDHFTETGRQFAARQSLPRRGGPAFVVRSRSDRTSAGRSATGPQA